MRILAELRFDLTQEQRDILEIVVKLRRRATLQIRKGEMNGDKKLAGFVVNGVGDSLDFFFEQFIHFAKSRDSILETTVAHLVGRQNFRQEFRGQGNEALGRRAETALAQKR